MDALTLLKTRRSVSARNLTFPGPNAREIDNLIEIAVRVPDHGKLAPWRFILFQGEARARAGDKLCALLVARGETDEQRLDFARTAFTRAPLVIGVISKAAAHPKIPEWEQQLSAGAVCLNLCLGAQAIGYGANWLTDWFAYDSEAGALLGVHATERVAGFVHIGTPTEPTQDRPRPRVEDVVSVFAG